MTSNVVRLANWPLWGRVGERVQSLIELHSATVLHLYPEMHAMTKMAFDERAQRLAILAKLAILAIFCQFRQVSSSIGIDTTWVNIDDFGVILPFSSN